LGEAEPGGTARLLIDLGPLLVFFAANFFAPVPGPAKIFVATGAFMAAMIAAMLASQIKFGRISPLLWFSGIMVVVMGGITIWLQDETFIKMKPTIVYLMFAAFLGYGVWANRPTLQMLLETAYPGLSERGWRLLSTNWAGFFLFMAALNEAFRHFLSFGGWLEAKLWVFLPLSFLFTFAHMPMLLRHWLGKEDEDEVITHTPHE